MGWRNGEGYLDPTAEMALGNPIISLTAIYDLIYDSLEIGKVLVICPLRVGLYSWPADVYIINRENVQ